MTVTSLYPVLMSKDVATAAAFYRETFGFETTFETDWYISLRLGAFELAILSFDHETVPESHRSLPRGVIVNIEVDDVDEVYRHLTETAGLTPVLALRDEDFGQRHCIVEAPDGVLLDVIQPIPPSEAFARAYSTDS
ncbi:VOC family protein [uncultured Agrococcus sp.]|uniref:VOC family protein n=1 Tax=uncultured Agrococcus sp. TaxID=382258 RepID=UPI0025E732D9|nr:VOC family protein [uncultured Agrococcus sp.]